MHGLSRVVLWSVSVALVVFGVLGLDAYPTGITGVTMKSSTPGCTCHSLSPSASVSVTISGPAALGPSQSGSYAVEVRGGPLQAAGTNIASSIGSLNPSDASLQKIGDELTHTEPKPSSGEVVRFDFSYTAPSFQGQAILYANGNSVNANGLNTGDAWNYANNLLVAIQPPTGVAGIALPGSFGLDQNYPNPFNPSTTINFALPVPATVVLRAYDAAGQVVAVILDGAMEAGYKTVRWAPAGLASGVYFYRLDATATRGERLFTASRKFIFMK